MRISTTTLESYRLFMEPEQEWMTEADLVATIRGEFVPTQEVLAGQAFGRILEYPDHYRIDGGYRRGDFVFPDATMAPAFDLIDRPHTVFEAKAVKRYGPHDVVSKADQLVGAHLTETKTTFGYFQFDKYAQSCQWRLMLDMFEAAFCTYHVFSLGQAKDETIELRAVDSFDVFPYVGLHDDCAELVAEFVDYVTRKGLARLLDERQAVAAA